MTTAHFSDELSPRPASPVVGHVACVLLHRRQLLVHESLHPATGEVVEQPLGGPLRQGEASADAIRRIVLEQTGRRIDFLQRLGVLETLVSSGPDENPAAHFLTVVYDGRFLDESLYADAASGQASGLHLLEDAAGEHAAKTGLRWRSLDDREQEIPLWPPDLQALLQYRSL